MHRWAELIPTISGYYFVYFILPAAGIGLAVIFIQVIRKGKKGQNVSHVMIAAEDGTGKVHADNSYTQLVTSALTAGFGGSVGLEAPIVAAGAGLGSTVGGIFNFKNHQRVLLMACGAAAGISAIFNSPVAGVFFAAEVVLFELSINVFIPLLISAAIAAVLSDMFHEGQLFLLVTTEWDLATIPLYLLLGVFNGLLAVYVTRSVVFTEAIFERIRTTTGKWALGGLLLGALIFLLPPLYGEGYSCIQELLNGNYQSLTRDIPFDAHRTELWFLLLTGTVLVLLKSFAAAITIGAGGNGGIFAPSLFIGAMAGFIFSKTINLLTSIGVMESNFIVAGMAGTMAGIIQAPLTAIFLTAEITGGFALFIPLIIVSTTGYLVAKYLAPESVYSRSLIEKGYERRKQING